MAALKGLVEHLSSSDQQRFRREIENLTSTFEQGIQFDRLDPVQVTMNDGLRVDGLALVNPGLLMLSASLPDGEMLSVGFTYAQVSVPKFKSTVLLPAGARLSGPPDLIKHIRQLT